MRINCFCLVFEFEHLNFFVAKQIVDKTESGKVSAQQLVFCIIFSLRNASLFPGEVVSDVGFKPLEDFLGGSSNKKLPVRYGTHN